MAKLTGAKKKAFLDRMAKGRKKAARAKNPKRKATKKKAAKKNPAKKPKKQARKKPAGRAPMKSHMTQMKRTVKTGTSKRGGTAKSKLTKARHTAKKEQRKGYPRGVPNGKKKGRRNPDDMQGAAELFEQFHQKPPGHIVTYEEMVRYPSHFAELGTLKELRVNLDRLNPEFPLTRFGECDVLCTPDGANIYFKGGDQAVDLAALDIHTDKDTVELGPCVYICYHTIKGFHDFAPTNYEHEFGEEDGETPTLCYDCLNKRLFLVGGNYQVKRPGIVN